MTSTRGPEQVVVVTGAARGIGRAVTDHFVKQGYLVAAWDADAEALSAVSGSEADPRLHTCTMDVSDPDSVAAAYNDTVGALGVPSVLVNNAGILGRQGSSVDLPIPAWERVFAVNVTGALVCSQAVVPGMMSQGWGRIVNIASIAGKQGNATNVAYASSKAALIGLTKSMGKELASSGVLVNCVTPAAADTSIFDHQDPAESLAMRQKLLGLVPMGRYVKGREIAEMVYWLGSDACSFSAGAIFDISGGRSDY